MQRCVIKFVSNLRQVGVFAGFFHTIKIDHHDITEILLKSGVKHLNFIEGKKGQYRYS